MSDAPDLTLLTAFTAVLAPCRPGTLSCNAAATGGGCRHGDGGTDSAINDSPDQPIDTKETSVLIEIGLFQGDELLQRGRIRVTEREQLEKNDLISLKHQLVENTARLELRVFEDGVQQIKSNLEMPVHQSDDWESIELAQYTLAFRCNLDA